MKSDEQNQLPVFKRDISGKQKLIAFIKLMIRRSSEANISDNAKIIAYYVLLSFFPLLIVIGNILPYFQLDVLSVADYVKSAVPPTIFNRIMPILQSLLNKRNSGLLSVGILGTLWAASKGINALKISINRAYRVDKIQNFILKRLISLGTTLVLLLLLVSLIVVFTFGQQFLEFITPIFKIPEDYINVFGQLKWPITSIVLFVILIFVYFFVPNVKMQLRSVLPGAFLTTVGWLILAQAFSLYMRYFGTSWNSYGTIGAFIILLLWLNYSAMVLMFGAVVNVAIEEAGSGQVDVSQGKVHDFIERRKEQNES
ncbi:YihY/virulence factor BrkB family protein [Latilactobacillus sakei]|uniref:YihY/virulence factor BrkB family protein n=1 Tax=Latilactobacillus sakei TaxID=1599 RepID=UPI00207301AB|nr:YihY/virulence factor BrkB family protein [Latilactobacillus sakei]USG06544.1 ribonuclease BN [Latilactobacillus sakei]